MERKAEDEAAMKADDDEEKKNPKKAEEEAPGALSDKPKRDRRTSLTEGLSLAGDDE